MKRETQNDVVERARQAIIHAAAGESSNGSYRPSINMVVIEPDVAARAALSTLLGLRLSILKVRDGYASQLKFCDTEAHGYFREFIRRIDAALNSTHGIESRD